MQSGNIRSCLNSNHSDWNTFITGLSVQAGSLGGRRYAHKDYRGTLCYNDIVKTTGRLFRENAPALDARQGILRTIKALDVTHIKRGEHALLSFLFLKACHFIKSFVGTLFYNRAGALKEMEEQARAEPVSSPSPQDNKVPAASPTPQVPAAAETIIPTPPAPIIPPAPEPVVAFPKDYRVEYLTDEEGQKLFPTGAHKINTRGEMCVGIFDLNKEQLRERTPDSPLLLLEGDLLVKKGFSMEKEFEIGNTLDHPCIAKSHALFIRKGQAKVQNIVMEKVKGKMVDNYYSNKIKLENAVVIRLIESLKECCSYLFDQKCFWRDINNFNIMIEDETNALKIVDLGDWGREEKPEDLAFYLLLGNMETVGWVLKSSKLREGDRKKVLPFIFLQEFCDGNVQLEQVLSSYSNSDAYKKGLAPARAKIEEYKNSPEALKAYILSYFDLVLEKFEKEFVLAAGKWGGNGVRPDILTFD